MHVRRRRFVASIAAGSAAAVAGCLEGVLDEVTTFEATPAEVADTTVEEAGYEHRGTDSTEEEREFAGQSVEVTSYVADYRRTIEVPVLGSTDSAVFAAVATPKVEVAGDTHNPIGEMDEAEIAAMVQEQYSNLTIGDTAGSRTVDTLGGSVTLETFEGTATVADESDIDVFVDVGRFADGDDFVVVVGVYPQLVAEEGDRIDAMARGLEHGDGG